MLPHLLSNRKSKKGGLLVEIVVVVGIIVGALVAILGLATAFLVTSQVVQQTSQATALAQEGLEIVRNYRDGISWNTDNAGIEYDGLGMLTPGTMYHLEKSTDAIPRWKMVAGTETIGIFTRKIELGAIQRDANSNIVVAGTPDPDTKKVTVTVSWQERERSHEVELAAYFTNWNQ